jgi:hypothetical protein
MSDAENTSTPEDILQAAKSFFNVPREKLSPRSLAAEAAQSRGWLKCRYGTDLN